MLPASSGFWSASVFTQPPPTQYLSVLSPGPKLIQHGFILRSLTNHVSKEPISIQGHILRLWMDTNFGATP